MRDVHVRVKGCKVTSTSYMQIMYVICKYVIESRGTDIIMNLSDSTDQTYSGKYTFKLYEPYYFKWPCILNLVGMVNTWFLATLAKLLMWQ